MYYRYFGLDEAPFSIAPNPHYLYMSPHHRDALAHLLYGVGVGGGFILLTGEVGTGKTTITRCLLEQLPDNIDLAMVLNPALNAQELLATACDELGIDTDASDTLKTLTDKLHQFLLSNHAKGRNTVLLIDEAQHLQAEVLEQIRLLTNLETNTKKLLQIVLVGQPELNAILARPELRQLNQRITARYKIQPLSLEETRAYISHRLQVAGLPGGQELFPESVVKGVYAKTGGLPRLINLLCDRILMGTYGQNKTNVDHQVFKQAAAEVFGEEASKGTRKSTRWLWLASCGVLLIAGLLAWHWSGGLRQPVIFAAQETAPDPVAQAGVELPASPSQMKVPQASVIRPERAMPVIAEQSQTDTPMQEPLDSAYLGEARAYFVLGTAMGLEPSLDPRGCTTFKRDVHCTRVELETWDDLRAFNRPAILSLITPGRQKVFAALLGISAEHAQLAVEGGEESYPLEELGTRWNGEAVILWRPPPGFDRPIGLWDQGETVAWLARGFAQIDGEPAPLTDEVFNRALEQRVKLFQTQWGLEADGVVGMKTLLRFNEALGLAHTLTPLNTLAAGSASKEG